MDDQRAIEERLITEDSAKNLFNFDYSLVTRNRLTLDRRPTIHQSLLVLFTHRSLVMVFGLDKTIFASALAD